MIHVSQAAELPRSGPVYIFGAGEAGKQLKDIYDAIPTAHVAGFIDNGKTGTLDGLPVYDFSGFLAVREPGSAVVLASVYLAEMAVQLSEAGISSYYNAQPLIETAILERRTETDIHDLGPVERLETWVEFLYRRLQRQENLSRACARALGLGEPRTRTLDAFEYQWSHDAVNSGPASHYNDDFRRRAPSNVCSLTGFDPSWFRGRSVLDGGCGDGRFSHALCRLGARVMSVDMSESGVRQASRNCAAFPDHRAKRANLLTLDLGEEFDLVFSFGVAHHTGDTELALTNLARHVKPGGYLTMMIYGQPRWERFGDVYYDIRKERLMQKVAHLSLEEAERVVVAECDENERQGWFDAVTPIVEDHYTVEQAVSMLRAAGLEEIVNLHVGSRHLYFRGRRPEART